MIIAAIIYAAYFYYFVDNNRFADIYAEYKSTSKFIQRQGARRVYWFLGLPLLLIPIILWWTTGHLHIDLTK
jgi:bacteriorhodopsin